MLETLTWYSLLFDEVLFMQVFCPQSLTLHIHMVALEFWTQKYNQMSRRSMEKCYFFDCMKYVHSSEIVTTYVMKLTPI